MRLERSDMCEVIDPDGRGFGRAVILASFRYAHEAFAYAVQHLTRLPPTYSGGGYAPLVLRRASSKDLFHVGPSTSRESVDKWWERVATRPAITPDPLLSAPKETAV